MKKKRTKRETLYRKKADATRQAPPITRKPFADASCQPSVFQKMRVFLFCFWMFLLIFLGPQRLVAIKESCLVGFGSSDNEPRRLFFDYLFFHFFLFLSGTPCFVILCHFWKPSLRQQRFHSHCTNVLLNKKVKKTWLAIDNNGKKNIDQLFFFIEPEAHGSFALSCKLLCAISFLWI